MAAPLKLISISEALDIIQDCDPKGVPIPFEVEFCTADRDRGTGGDIIHYKKAIWHVKGGKVRDESTSAGNSPQKPKKQGAKRWVRKVRAFNSDQIRNLNSHLILTINGMRVR